MAVTKGETEFYLTLDDILFFETVGNAVAVHTADQIYQTKLRLYELEEILPGSFYESFQVDHHEHRQNSVHS